MATVWKDTRRRANGTRPWCIRWKGLDGRWRRERTNAQNKVQAQAILGQRLRKLTEAEVTGVQSVEALQPKTFSEFVTEEYLPHCEPPTCTQSTYKGYKYIVQQAKPFFGDMLLRAITLGDIKRYIDSRKNRQTRYKRPVRPATVNRELMLLSGIFTEAVARGYIDRNPAHGISQLPEHNDKLRWLTDDEEDAIMKRCPDWLGPIVQTALLTGMRKEEILTLEWGNVDLDRREIRVVRTKNHKTRYIPINAALHEILGPFRGAASAAVFPNPRTGLPYRDISHAFQRACDAASVSGVTFHTLRHTFASRLVQAGVPLNTVRELLGHSSIKVTMRYAHLAPNNLREAVSLLKRTRSVQNSVAKTTSA